MWWRRARRGESKVSHFEGVLGTTLEFQAVADDQSILNQAEKAVLSEIDRLESIFSRYREDSELAIWEKIGGPVSPELAELLERAEAWREKTAGAFHPAVEALTRLWKAGTPKQMELEAIVKKLQAPLWTVQGSRVVRHTDLPANLNAIAKGHIIDRAAEAARVEGIDTILVNIGGDLRHLGGKPIEIDITDPRKSADNAAPISTVTLKNAGMATSGLYHRGKHLFDPRSGLPVEHLASASVIAEDALTADVLATAFAVLHPCESIELADSLPNVACFLVSADGRRFANRLWSRYEV